MSHLELETTLERYVEKIDMGYSCTFCGKIVRDRTAARNHVEALHIPSQGHTCLVCGKLMKTKNAYWIHMSRIHNQKWRPETKLSPFLFQVWNWRIWNWIWKISSLKLVLDIPAINVENTVWIELLQETMLKPSIFPLKGILVLCAGNLWKPKTLWITMCTDIIKILGWIRISYFKLCHNFDIEFLFQVCLYHQVIGKQTLIISLWSLVLFIHAVNVANNSKGNLPPEIILSLFISRHKATTVIFVANLWKLNMRCTLINLDITNKALYHNSLE